PFGGGEGKFARKLGLVHRAVTFAAHQAEQRAPQSFSIHIETSMHLSSPRGNRSLAEAAGEKPLGIAGGAVIFSKTRISRNGWLPPPELLALFQEIYKLTRYENPFYPPLPQRLYPRGAPRRDLHH